MNLGQEQHRCERPLKVTDDGDIIMCGAPAENSDWCRRCTKTFWLCSRCSEAVKDYPLTKIRVFCYCNWRKKNEAPPKTVRFLRPDDPQILGSPDTQQPLTTRRTDSALRSEVEATLGCTLEEIEF